MAIPGFGEIAERLRRSTVLIRAGARASGSGVIWSADGVIVTNAHVMCGSPVSVELWDGRQLETSIVSRDPWRDIVLLRANAGNLPAAAPDLSEVRAGEVAIAIGNPLGFIGALTTGTVHRIGPVRGLGPQPWIQANLQLAPGNSGGPLANAIGGIIGINTMIAGRLALAIPSKTVADFLSAGPSGSWLGVTVHPVEIPRMGGQSRPFGLVVLEIETDSPAANASLLPGDILLGTEEKPFTSVADLASLLRDSGERVQRLEFLRGDYSRVRRVTVQLAGQSISGSSVAA